MRLLVISNLFPPAIRGGYEILCDQVAKALAGRGHDVRVLTTVPEHPLREERDSPVEVERSLHLFRPFSQAAGRGRWRQYRAARHNYAVSRACIERVRPDVVFVWSQLRLTPACAHAARDAGAPTLYTLNDEHPAGFVSREDGGRLRRALRTAVDRWVAPRLTLEGLDLSSSLVISQVLKSNLLRHRVPIEEACVVSQGIPLERFPLRAAPGVVHTPVRLLYTGQLHAYKGVHTLVEAAHELTRRRPSLTPRVSIVGAGDADYEAALRDRAERGPAEIDFVGRVAPERLPAIYREHDIFVFPSIWQEPFGLTHLEAMASGLPVVSTANGGQGEFLEHGHNALVFEPEDVSTLVEHMLRLIENPRLRDVLVKQGRKSVEQRFTLAGYVDEIERHLLARAEMAA